MHKPCKKCGTKVVIITQIILSMNAKEMKNTAKWCLITTFLDAGAMPLYLLTQVQLNPRGSLLDLASERMNAENNFLIVV